MRRFLMFIPLMLMPPVAAQQTLIPSVTHLDFSLTYPDATPQTQTFTLTSSTGSPVEFAMALNPLAGRWLFVAVSSYRTPATITVTAQRLTFESLDFALITFNPTQGPGLIVPVTMEYWPPASRVDPSVGSADPTSIHWNYTLGGALPTSTEILGNLPGGLFGYSANALSDVNWLQVNNQFGASGTVQSGSASVRLNCQCDRLSPGTYSGVIYALINAGNRVDSSATYAKFAIPVSLTVSSPATTVFAASLGSLGFDYQAGTSAPPAQTVAVSSTPSGSTFRVDASTRSGTWLTATSSSPITPANLSVSVNPAGLVAGTYTGTVALTPSNGNAISIPVTLIVRPAAGIAVSPASVDLSWRKGDAPPAPRSIQITGGGTSPTFGAQVSPGASWLSVSPLSSTAPAAISFAVDPTKLAPASYSASVVVTGTGSAAGAVTIPVTLQVTAPLPTILSVVNAAGYSRGSVAPGEMVAVFGTDIGPDSLTGLTLDSSGAVATTLGGMQVLFDGVPAPLVYASGTQAAAVAPYELAIRKETTVQVSFAGQKSNGTNLAVVPTDPGIFTANSSGTGPGAIVNSDGSVNSPGNPAARGDVVVVYLTGEGQTVPAGVSGKVTTVNANKPLTPTPVLPVSVLVGGIPADFLFAGEAPGVVSGVLQLNVVIPSNAPQGELPIVVSVGAKPSQSGVTVSVK
jgi:uncharacterized protein (TIGR03437 family)